MAYMLLLFERFYDCVIFDPFCDLFDPFWGGTVTVDVVMQAASYMINAGIVATAEEQEVIFRKVLTNSVTICSWSPFNQYWILQALGNLGKMDCEAGGEREREGSDDVESAILFMF